MKGRVKRLESDLRTMPLGPEGGHGALGKWLLRSTTLLARPHAIYNHLVIFNKLGEVIQISDVYRHDVPSMNIEALCAAPPEAPSLQGAP